MIIEFNHRKIKLYSYWSGYAFSVYFKNKLHKWCFRFIPVFSKFAKDKRRFLFRRLR
jgi:hypothetical protein